MGTPEVARAGASAEGGNCVPVPDPPLLRRRCNFRCRKGHSEALTPPPAAVLLLLLLLSAVIPCWGTWDQQAASSSLLVGNSSSPLPRTGTGVDWAQHSAPGANQYKTTLPSSCPKSSSHAPTAEAFIRSWISNPGPTACGHWQTRFKKLHSSIRSSRGTEAPDPTAQRRYVTFQDPWRAPKVKPGLGDHLLGMASAFLVALLTDRAFVMEESRLLKHVQPAEVDWTVGEDVPGPEQTVETVYLNYGRHWEDSVRFPSNIKEHFQGPPWSTAENIRLGTNGGVLSRIFSNSSSPTYRALHAMGMRMPTAFGCITRFLITPKEEVWQPLLPLVPQLLLEPRTSAIGIHMRTADRFAWKTGGRTAVTLPHVWRTAESRLLQCALDIEEFSIPDKHRTLWLFLSDSWELRKKVQRKYPGYVVSTGIEPRHPRFHGEDSWSTVLSEWLLFSMSKSFVINECGFSKTAVAYNLQSPRVFLFGHYIFSGAEGACDQARPSSLLDFNRWSGL